MGFLDKLKDAGKGVLKEAVKASGVKITYNGEPLFAEEVKEEPKEPRPTVPAVEYLVVTDFELSEQNAGEWIITKFIGFEEENIEIPAEIDGKKVVAIGDAVFANLKGIKNFKLAEGIRYIGAKAFFESGVETVLLPNTLQEVGEAAFENSSLVLIEFPDDIKEIGKCCCHGCVSLKYAKLPKNMDVVRAEMFHGCEALAELEFPESTSMIEESAVAVTAVKLTEIPSSCIVLKEAALAYSFNERVKAEEIVLPPNLQIIGEHALSGINARKIVIPASVKGIFPEAFNHAKYLEEIIIEDGCEATLADGAFVNCDKLKMLTIPKSVTKIGALFVKDDTLFLHEDVKDEYGRQCYDEKTGEKIVRTHTQAIKNNDVPEGLTIYCEAGSAAMDFARKNDIPFARAVY